MLRLTRFFPVLITLCLAGRIEAAPTLTEVLVPQYIQGTNGSTNAVRIPYAYRVTLSGLTANATYRYYNQVVDATENATVNGAGNMVFVNLTGSFLETSNPGINTAGGYSTFLTDVTGSFTGWFVTEPSGNVRFSTGYPITLQIMLNDGAGGTSIVTRLRTTSTVNVLNWGSGGANGTGVMAKSGAFTPKNFVMLYDNTAGTGRPIAGTLVENDGASETANFVTFYVNNIEAQNGAWGAIVPNTLNNGVERVETRALADGSIVLAGTLTDSDGMWPVSGANTVNPTGGTTPLDLSLDLPIADWTLYQR